MNVRILSAAVLALSLAACSTPGSSYNSGYSNNSSNAYRGQTYCQDCGVVQNIQSYTGERRTTGGGAVAGAIIGGVLGNQIGGGDGKKVATVAGAVAGGFAGNAIEKNMDKTWYEVSVRMNDGRQISVTQNDLNGIRNGSSVVIQNGEARLR
jgi:outer membrane lipoprotein SlyB